MTSLFSASVVLEVDLSAVQQNYRYMRSMLDRHVVPAAVVKSDAYGLGLRPVARALRNTGCDFFFVANMEEALELRSECPTVAIAVFRDNLAENEALYKRHHLIPVANRVADIRLLEQSVSDLSYFVHLDTGLTRLGLCPAEFHHHYLTGNLDSPRLLGVLSHLACGSQFEDATNERQLNRFESVYRLLQPKLGSLVASGGVWLGKRYHYDMVRIGSALFGLNEARIQPNPLTPVVRLATQIVDVRKVPRNEVVGYGATFRTQRNSRIAVAAAGYTQGLPWSCGNRSALRLGPFACPIIGRISMEYLTIDVTDVPERLCYPGATVEILNDAQGADDFAQDAGIISQELLLSLGSACPKRYLTERADQQNSATSSLQKSLGHRSGNASYLVQ